MDSINTLHYNKINSLTRHLFSEVIIIKINHVYQIITVQKNVLLKCNKLFIEYLRSIFYSITQCFIYL